MPYSSEAQRGKLHALAKRGEISKGKVAEFDRASKGMNLPLRANRKGGKKRGILYHIYSKGR